MHLRGTLYNTNPADKSNHHIQLEPESRRWLESLVAFRSLPNLQWKKGESFWLQSVVASGTSQISERTVCLSKHMTSHLRFHSLLKSRSAGNIYTLSILLLFAGFSYTDSWKIIGSSGSTKFSFAAPHMLAFAF